MIPLRTLIAIACIFCSVGFAQTNKKAINKLDGNEKGISKSNGAIKNIVVKGKVTQTWSYCGGAAPSEEMLEEARRPRPYEGKVFYIRKGKINSLKEPMILSFTVSAAGTFSFQLPAGVYSIIQDTQLKALNFNDYNVDANKYADKDCLKKWWAQAYYVLEIKDKNITNLNFEFHHACFVDSDIPCLQYVGPMPP